MHAIRQRSSFDMLPSSHSSQPWTRPSPQYWSTSPPAPALGVSSELTPPLPAASPPATCAPVPASSDTRPPVTHFPPVGSEPVVSYPSVSSPQATPNKRQPASNALHSLSILSTLRFKS